MPPTTAPDMFSTDEDRSTMLQADCLTAATCPFSSTNAANLSMQPSRGLWSGEYDDGILRGRRLVLKIK